MGWKKPRRMAVVMEAQGELPHTGAKIIFLSTNSIRIKDYQNRNVQSPFVIFSNRISGQKFRFCHSVCHRMEVSLLRLPPPSFNLNEHQENTKKQRKFSSFCGGGCTACATFSMPTYLDEKPDNRRTKKEVHDPFGFPWREI